MQSEAAWHWVVFNSFLRSTQPVAQWYPFFGNGCPVQIKPEGCLFSIATGHHLFSGPSIDFLVQVSQHPITRLWLLTREITGCPCSCKVLDYSFVIHSEFHVILHVLFTKSCGFGGFVPG